MVIACNLLDSRIIHDLVSTESHTNIIAGSLTGIL